MAVILVFSFVFMFSGCKGRIDRNDAKTRINSFFDTVEEENYELAPTYLHPDLKVDLANFFKNLKEQENIDFASGVEIVKYTGFTYSYYQSTVSGSSYGLDLLVSVGGTKISMNIETVKNSSGYGIYSFKTDI